MLCWVDGFCQTRGERLHLPFIDVHGRSKLAISLGVEIPPSPRVYLIRLHDITSRTAKERPIPDGVKHGYSRYGSDRIPAISLFENLPIPTFLGISVSFGPIAAGVPGLSQKMHCRESNS